jgi:hypothetical protein
MDKAAFHMASPDFRFRGSAGRKGKVATALSSSQQVSAAVSSRRVKRERGAALEASGRIPRLPPQR